MEPTDPPPGPQPVSAVSAFGGPPPMPLPSMPPTPMAGSPQLNYATPFGFAGPAAPFTLQYDVPCIQCGYNLRGLNTDGRCPECGSPVAQSLQRNYLRFSHPLWVMGLMKAVNLMLISILVGIVGGIIARPAGMIAALLVTLVNAGLQLAAYWMLTEPEPQARETENGVTLRKALRVFVVLGVAGTLVQAGGQIIGSEPLVITGGIIALASLPSTWLFYLYLRKLAFRVPDERLAGQAWIIMWGLTISLAIVLLAALLVFAARSGALLVVAGIGGLGALVFGIWSIVMLFNFRKVFTTAYQAAIANWGQSGPPAASAWPTPRQG